MTSLTRRRERETAREKWHTLHAGVCVGSIGLRSGGPNHADQWEWKRGFYPSCDPGQATSGPAGTFEEARTGFEAAWRQLLPTRTRRDLFA
ncbi:hypothetical protein [Bradyrhizobium sp. CCBAU 51753]|uniref:hypothetical protein n=1 Tax=Bradyrhizobium sp. CCBAU 51753 TaxID=1325100 RepID=UPI00188A66C6|nr:hypothetical protein [Bradyrhizobium sp. CCBAU 51753]QOZ25909.1 hypothetical protein XH93_21565 [Bradyrhizobium sp. CCBAU 51753]